MLTNKINERKVKFFKKKGFKILYFDSLITKNNFTKIFQKIFKLGYRRVFFETGLTFLNSLITYKLLDNLYVFKSNSMLKKNGFNNITSQYLKKIKLNNKITINLDDNNLYKKEF